MKTYIFNLISVLLMATVAWDCFDKGRSGFGIFFTLFALITLVFTILGVADKKKTH